MSIEAVKDFYEKIAKDEDFQNKLNELQNKATEGLELPLAQDKKEEIIKDVIIPFAKKQGFDFSIEDIKEFEQSIIEQLDEEQLDNISAAYDGWGLGICIKVGVGSCLIFLETSGGFPLPYPTGFCLLLGIVMDHTLSGCFFVGGGI